MEAPWRAGRLALSSSAAALPGPDGLAPPPEVEPSRLRRRLLALVAIVVVVAVLISVVPGLASLRSRFAHGDPAWLSLGAALKLLSGLSYVAAFRSVFCRGMRWRTSAQIGLSELGANAVIPTGGFGGLALGAWALHRGGMDSGRIARRSVAFFFLTSVPNVLGVIIIGAGLALGVFDGRASLALSIVPAAVAAAAAERHAARAGSDSRLAAALRTLAGGVEEALALLRERDPWLLLGLAGYLAFDVMIVWATFHAFGSVPPLAIVWFAYLIGELGGLLPVPGGIGGVDLGLVGTYVLYHVPLAAATAAVLAYRALALLVPMIVGGIAFLTLRRALAREALAISSCAPGEEVEIIGRGRVQVRPIATYSLEAVAREQ